MGRRINALGLAALTALAGCTTTAPNFNPQTSRYEGERTVEDRGRIVQGLGAFLGGGTGLLLQAMGSYASKEQQRQLMEERMYGMQRQIDQANAKNFDDQVYEVKSNLAHFTPEQRKDLQNRILEDVTKQADDTAKKLKLNEAQKKAMIDAQIAQLNQYLPTISNQPSPEEELKKTTPLQKLEAFVKTETSSGFTFCQATDLNRNGEIEPRELIGLGKETITSNDNLYVGIISFNPRSKLQVEHILPNGKITKYEGSSIEKGRIWTYQVPSVEKMQGTHSFSFYEGEIYLTHVTRDIK